MNVNINVVGSATSPEVRYPGQVRAIRRMNIDTLSISVSCCSKMIYIYYVEISTKGLPSCQNQPWWRPEVWANLTRQFCSCRLLILRSQPPYSSHSSLASCQVWLVSENRYLCPFSHWRSSHSGSEEMEDRTREREKERRKICRNILLTDMVIQWIQVFYSKVYLG